MFTLSFKTENAAFEDLNAETARILRAIAARIESGQVEGRAIDVNGNTIGVYQLTRQGQ